MLKFTDEIIDSNDQSDRLFVRSPSRWQSQIRLERGLSNRYMSIKGSPTQGSPTSNQTRIKTSLKYALMKVIEPQKQSQDLLSPEEKFFHNANRLQLPLTIEDMENISFEPTKYTSQFTEMEELGEGCIGLVRALENNITGERFAVKKVTTSDEEIICNMIMEFKCLIKVNHPNIVKVFKLFVDFKDGFQNQSNIYVVMELVEGKEMFEYIQQLGNYSESIARKLFSQLMDAINYLHQHGICHRDLKPNNILCSEDGETIKITDFNVSKFSENYKEFSDLETTDQIEMWTYTGTVAFSAPEIFVGYGYNEKVDIWSAGCILYTMLSGQMPFTREFLNDLIDLIVSGEYSFSGEQWKDISSEAKNLIENLLVIDVEKRFSASQALNHIWLQSESSVELPSIERLDLNKNLNRLTCRNQNPRAKKFLLGINIQHKSDQNITINLESDIVNQIHSAKNLECSYFHEYFDSPQSKTSVECIFRKGGNNLSKFSKNPFKSSPPIKNEFETSDKQDKENINDNDNENDNDVDEQS